MDMLKTHFTIFTPHKKTPQYNDISYKSISEARFCPQVARDIYTHTNIYMTCKCTSELGVLGVKKAASSGDCTTAGLREAEQEPGWARARCHLARLARCGGNLSVSSLSSNSFLLHTTGLLSVYYQCWMQAQSQWWLCLSAFPRQFSQPILFFFWFL